MKRGNNVTDLNSYSYDPCGEQTTATQTVSNPWRYTAGLYDGTTGLTKVGTRYYNPGEARFTQRDPTGKDLTYAYTGNNPTNNTDPTGTDILGDVFGGIFAAAAIAVVGVSFVTGLGEIATGSLLFGFADIAAGGAGGTGLTFASYYTISGT